MSFAPIWVCISESCSGSSFLSWDLLEDMFVSWYTNIVHTRTLVGQTACDTVLSLEFGESVLLSNTWLINMKAGCRAVQTRHSWITPRWEATNTGLLTTILRRQVKQLQMKLCRWMWLLFGQTLYSFLCFIESFEVSCSLAFVGWAGAKQTMKSSHRIVHSDWNCEDESACLSLLSESAFVNPAVVRHSFLPWDLLQNMFFSWYMCTWIS